MSHPLVLKRRAWRLVPPQAGHARVVVLGPFAAGVAISGAGVCKERVFISNTGSAAGAWLPRLETWIVRRSATVAWR
jgi:hypothetical protein